MADYDCTREDIGNARSLEHVNTRVPDHQLAALFYVMRLSSTRYQYLVTGTTNMWINIGRSQFHLSTGDAQVVRGRTGLNIPGRAALVARLAAVSLHLSATRFSFTESDNTIDVSWPWGKKILCHEPDHSFGRMPLGMPYVEYDAPPGSAPAVAEFCGTVVETNATVDQSEGQPSAKVAAGEGQSLICHEVDAPAPTYDGYHIAGYLTNFSRPHQRLLKCNLISEESNQHKFRFFE